MPLDPKAKFYASAKAPIAVKIVFGLSILLLLATFVVVHCSWGGKLGKGLLYVFIGIWAVAPPVWFWCEYFFVYRAHGEQGTLELFKYGQDLSKAIWAAVLAGLIAFAASDAVKPSTNVASDCPCRVMAKPSK
jgi:hypothetical protein